MPTLIFHGHACFELVGSSTRILLDPFLTGNPLADVGPDELPRPDTILVTHGHGDHLGDALAIARRHGVPIVAPNELAMFCRQEGADVHPMHIGGSRDFPFGQVKMVVAFHGGGVDADESGRFTTFPCGYLVTVDDLTVYHAGDTALTVEMQLLEGRVDVMLVPIGDNFTMGPEDAGRAVAMVKPRLTIPMHFNTFDIIEVDPERFRRAVGDVAEVRLLNPGDAVDL